MTTNETSKPTRRSRSGKPAVDGFILVDKPKGITSFDVIRELRKILRFRKMGHMGTLDPNATGLLPICTGRATRLSRFLLNGDKTYIATIRLGRTTNTYDIDGEFDGDPVEVPKLSDDELRAQLDAFTGEIDQMPPKYSAKKVEGKRLYEYARAGEDIERETCRVRIDSIDVLERGEDLLKIEVSSSSGMYVRSLAHDLGQRIGCGAFLEELSRTRVGNLFLKNAFGIDAIAGLVEKEDQSFIKPMHEMLPGMPALPLNASQIHRIRNGNHVVAHNPTLADGQHVRLMSGPDELIAIGTVRKPLGSAQIQVLPKVVFG